MHEIGRIQLSYTKAPRWFQGGTVVHHPDLVYMYLAFCYRGAPPKWLPPPQKVICPLKFLENNRNNSLLFWKTMVYCPPPPPLIFFPAESQGLWCKRNNTHLHFQFTMASLSKNSGRMLTLAKWDFCLVTATHKQHVRDWKPGKT